MKASGSIVVGMVVAAVVGTSAGCTSKIQGSGTTATVSSPSSSVSDDGRSVASYFKVGDCLRDRPEAGTDATLVDCAELHSTEVYGVFMLPDGDFPGASTIKEYVDKCPALARQYATPEEGLDPTMQTVRKSPDQQSWGIGDRSVTCFLAFDVPRAGAFGAGRWIK